MRKHMLLICNTIIILSIIAGFSAIVYRDTTTYQHLAENYLGSIISLADTDISKQIENSMSKPVMVSKTMANDEFLKEWLLQEPENAGNGTYTEKLFCYLKAYQGKYDYTTVFCVSAETGNYYYQDGLNKTISQSDEHDVWYYNFIESGNEYDLEVDTNEAKANVISVFINFRVEGDDGQLLGVIGVGLQVSSIEDMIRAYEKDYDLSVYIINVGGVKTSFTGETDIFLKQEDLAKRTGVNETISMSKSSNSELQWFTSGGKRKCMIVTYNDTLEWYLVIKKDTSSINSMFQESVKSNVVFMLISLLLCIMVTMIVFIAYNRRMVVIENTDELTGLWSRKLFFKQYPAFVRKHRKQKKTLFMFDIDHFKNINDTYGHMFGNAVLSMVGKDLQNAIDGKGMAARWGGDEFVGILSVSADEAECILSQFMDELQNDKKNDRYRVTISTGIVEINGMLSSDQLIKKADKALYCSKENGRDRITICKDA